MNTFFLAFNRVPDNSIGGLPLPLLLGELVLGSSFSSSVLTMCISELVTSFSVIISLGRGCLPLPFGSL